MATFQNNKKQDWLSHKTSLVLCMARFLKDSSRNSITFTMELFPTTGNGRAYNQWAVISAVTGPSVRANLQSDENGHALQVASDTFSFFVDMFLHFFKNIN